jgi:prolyl oligopeptidase
MPESGPSIYPEAARQPIEERLHGHLVADPYRWLEDVDASDTAAWAVAEDRLWAGWAADHRERDVLADRLMTLIPGVRSAPFVVGERRFWTQRAPGQDHGVLFVADAAGTRALVDPNAIDPDGKVTLDGWSPSIEGDRLAYLLSSGGDEEARLWIIDVAAGTVLDGPIDRLRYSPIAWLPGGQELFYVRRLAPGAVPAGEEQYHRRVWRHRVSADPDGDELVFGGEGHGPGVDKTAYLDVEVSPDGARIAVTVALGTAPRNDLYVADLEGDRHSGWRPVIVGVDAQAWPHWDRAGALWLLTDLDAPRRRVVRADPTDPAPERWQEIIGEDPEGGVLESYVLAGERVVVVHNRHALSVISVHGRAGGDHQRDIALPGPGTADVTGRRDEGDELWLGWTTYVTPYAVAPLDPATGELGSPAPVPGTSGETGSSGADASSPSAGVHSEQVSFRSADGTLVRMTVISPDVTPNHPRPTVLYGYGGFNISLTPAYSSAALAWVQAGGVWAVANLRGGSEEGEAWHRDGMRERKHHVFEDFEAAADALVAGGWTTSAQLGIMGGSNGGLLVGVALTRSPERYRAVVCSAPLLDMVRYERFGLGVTWNDEYGTADDPTELGWLLSYSPYHHVVQGVEYPATLFTVFDGDTRVDPLHARKLAAALQRATAGDPAIAPILLRREADVGHGARSVRRTVQLSADELGFLAAALGLPLPGSAGRPQA